MESQATPCVVAFVEVSAKMGGVQFSTLYLAKNMSPSTFRSVVICPEEGDLTDRCRQEGVNVRILSQPALWPSSFRVLGKHIPNILAWLMNPILLLWIAVRLSKVLQRSDIQIVCTKGLYAHFYGGLAARFAGIPCVWHAQDFISEKMGVLYPTVFSLLARLLADRVIADGTPIRDQLMSLYSQSRVDVIFNGVDLDKFSPQIDGKGVRTEWTRSSDEIIICNVARLTPWKGQDYLIKAFSRIAAALPKAKLVLVGAPVFDSDFFERRLRNLVHELQIEDRVVFAGFRWDLPEVLAATDIYVHCSIEKDTSPLAVVSAIASGKPIVFTRVPGVAELFVDGENGLGVPPSDEHSLADALTKCVSDDSLRTLLGDRARRTAELSLGIAQFTEAIEQVFNKVLRENE